MPIASAVASAFRSPRRSRRQPISREQLLAEQAASEAALLAANLAALRDAFGLVPPDMPPMAGEGVEWLGLYSIYGRRIWCRVHPHAADKALIVVGWRIRAGV